MRNSPVISVVLPVYNGAPFLKNAVASVLAQSFDDWELFIVDDGSTDGSSEICDALSSSDTRITVFHQPNEGVNSARAKGVDHACGKYLMFLDADDTFLPNAFKSVMDVIEDGVGILAEGKNTGVVNNEEYILTLLKGKVGPALWGKVFLTSVFKQVDYHLERDIVMGEDLLINLLLCLNDIDVKLVKAPFYSVNLNNSGSVTKTFNKSWAYEKYYFKILDSKFTDKCRAMSNYDEIVMYVNKSKLNGIKYVMLDGNSINYGDEEFKVLKNYFSNNKSSLAGSERLIFIVKSSKVYKYIIRAVQWIKRHIK